MLILSIIHVFSHAFKVVFFFNIEICFCTFKNWYCDLIYSPFFDDNTYDTEMLNSLKFIKKIIFIL